MMLVMSWYDPAQHEFWT